MTVFPLPPPPSAQTKPSDPLKPFSYRRWEPPPSVLNPCQPPEPPDPPDPPLRNPYPSSRTSRPKSWTTAQISPPQSPPISSPPRSFPSAAPPLVSGAPPLRPFHGDFVDGPISPATALNDNLIEAQLSNLSPASFQKCFNLRFVSAACYPAGDVLTRNATLDELSSYDAGDDYFLAWPIFISFAAEASIQWAWPIVHCMVYDISAFVSLRSWPHIISDIMLNVGNPLSSSRYGMRCLQPSSLARERSIPLSSLSRERSISFSFLLRERSLMFSFLNRKRIIPFCHFSLEEDVISDLIPRTLFNLSTNLLSCVAVCSGPEDAFGFVSTIFVGESWFSTSHLKVTISQHSSFAVKVYPTHLTFGSDLLSIYLGVFSTLICISFVFYCSNQRGWIIPSVCIPQV